MMDGCISHPVAGGHNLIFVIRAGAGDADFAYEMCASESARRLILLVCARLTRGLRWRAHVRVWPIKFIRFLKGIQIYFYTKLRTNNNNTGKSFQDICTKLNLSKYMRCV